MKRAALAVATLALGAATVLGCGGKKGELELKIVVSPIDDPFISASEVRFTVGPKVQSVPVTQGHFEFELEQKPPEDVSPILVEALDAAGNIVGHGQTPPLKLVPINQDPIAVWVGRPGSVAAAKAVLPSPRVEMAAYGATGLGAVFAGGRGADGAPLVSTGVYDVYTQDMAIVKDMPTPRAGAAAIASAPRGIVFGGAQAQGFFATGAALASGDLFDPTGGGLWAAVPADATPQARSRATTIVLGSGSGLVSGGYAEDGSPIATALLISTGGTARLSPISMPMVSARHRHAAAAARFPDGDGALLVGGLDPGDPGPAVERLIGQGFTTYTANGVENRWDATATSVAGGVMLVGGTIDMAGTRVATSSIVFIPTEQLGDPVRFDTLLPTARAGHTATKIGDLVLLCGGIDAAGAPIASCDLMNTNPYGFVRTIPTGVARKDHVAIQLETGPVLIAGGRGAGDALLDSIEIFTP